MCNYVIQSVNDYIYAKLSPLKGVVVSLNILTNNKNYQ